MAADYVDQGERVRVIFRTVLPSTSSREDRGELEDTETTSGGPGPAESKVPVDVVAGTTVYDAATAAGVCLNAPCGGGGTCGKCRVLAGRGLSEPGALERRLVGAADLAAGIRLACQACILTDVEIGVPAGSLSDFGHRIVTQSVVARTVSADPGVLKRYLTMRPPERGDDVSDVCRLRRELDQTISFDLAALRRLPGVLRELEFRGTVVTAGDSFLDFEPGDTTSESFAVALDVGTTTMAAELIDLTTGKILAVGSRLNPQTAFGDDVLSRILYTQNNDDGLLELHRCVISAANGLIRELLEETSTRETAVYRVVVAGNTTMQQLFLMLDPKPLGIVPFVPAAVQGLSVGASRLGLAVHPGAEVRTLPIIGGFVGGDVTAGILATELSSVEGPALFVDIGTNGEIVLWTGDRLIAASTAAGPAFEGARISRGMRACRGAIDRVAFEDGFRVHVIDGTRPVGLCGSALIDLAAELLRLGGLTSDGRLLDPESLRPDAPDELRERLVGGAFVLADESESGTDSPVLVTQRDFRELQLAAGAIRAGIQILLGQSGIEAEQLAGLFLAGGFGNFIRRDNAQRIGLLPGGVSVDRVFYQGNTSLAGARLVAISRRCAQIAEEMAAACEHVDLSSDPRFAMAFAEAMLFPET